jgi:hypothetical protein
VVIAGSSSDYLCGISAGGKVVWSRHLASVPTALAAVPGCDDILVGTASGVLYRVEGRQGGVRAQVELAGPISSIAVMSHRGLTRGYVGAGETLAAARL